MAPMVQLFERLDSGQRWAFSAIFKDLGLSLAPTNCPHRTQNDSTLSGMPWTGWCLKRGLGV
jgi:hypothetical protein